LLVVFFFQAEDGIRDGHVTGVQTCALPISSSSRAQTCAPCASFTTARARRSHRSHPPTWTGPPRSHVRNGSTEPESHRRSVTDRSEERRVGKECRGGWSRSPEK